MKLSCHAGPRLRRGLAAVLAALLLAGAWLGATAHEPGSASAQAPSDAGYIGPSHGGLSAPTSEKPESKLWYNDGYWWGNLYAPDSRTNHIFRFDPRTFEWFDTGTTLDPRTGSKADVLWDDAIQKLYVVSHVFSTSAAPTSAASNWGQLFRYSYDAVTDIYTLDHGFPVAVTRGKSETLTIDKDSTGQLWVTYVENRQVMFNSSQGDDLTWGEPRRLPTANTLGISRDDIAAVVAFGGDKIGIGWSDQRMPAMYFAVHDDADDDAVWQQETITSGKKSADDHINFATDSAGRVYMASKTDGTEVEPLVVLHVRDTGGAWSTYPFGAETDGHTRPVVVVDETNNQLHMFAAAPETGGTVYYKRSRLDDLGFPEGQGEIVLRNLIDARLNNVTTTKQRVDASTGLLILASGSSNRYFFNYFPLTEEPDNRPPDPPSSPRPIDGAASAATTLSLNWVGGDPDPGDSVAYDVLFGTAPDALTPICAGLTEPVCAIPETLANNMDYYWRVSVTDRHGASRQGPLWRFTTEPVPVN